MKKDEFKVKLYEELDGIRTDEKEKILDYFDEMILDAVENGEDEEGFIEKLGSISKIAERVKIEQKIEEKIKEVKEKPGVSNSIKALFAIMALPIALPMALIVVVLAFVFILLIFILYITFYAVSFSMAVSGFALTIYSLILIPKGIMVACAYGGMGLMVFGVGILFSIFTISSTKFLGKCIGSILNFITKRIFRRRR